MYTLDITDSRDVVCRPIHVLTLTINLLAKDRIYDKRLDASVIRRFIEQNMCTTFFLLGRIIFFGEVEGKLTITGTA